jgi:hypothetical protein
LTCERDIETVDLAHESRILILTIGPPVMTKTEDGFTVGKHEHPTARARLFRQVVRPIAGLVDSQSVLDHSGRNERPVGRLPGLDMYVSDSLGVLGCRIPDFQER